MNTSPSSLNSKTRNLCAGFPKKVVFCRKWLSPRKARDWLEKNSWRYGTQLVVYQEAAHKRIQVDFFPQTSKQKREFIREHGARVIELMPDVWWHPENPRARPLLFGKKLALVTTAQQYKFWEPRIPKRRIVIIGPGMAFGSGQHVTTAMCLRQLDKITSHLMRTVGDCKEVNCIDWGTGSGVLAISAKKLGLGKVLGVDVDPVAVRVAEENSKLYQVDIEYHVGDVVNFRVPFHAQLVFANLYSTLLCKAARNIQASVARGGFLVLSGIRWEQLAEVRARYCCLEEQICLRRAGWLCMVFKKPGVLHMLKC